MLDITSKFSVNFVITAMLLGTIDFCHFISLTLTLPGGHNVFLASFSRTHEFSATRVKFDLVLKQFKLNIMKLILSENYMIQGNTCCFADCVKNNNNNKTTTKQKLQRSHAIGHFNN